MGSAAFWRLAADHLGAIVKMSRGLPNRRNGALMGCEVVGHVHVDGDGEHKIQARVEGDVQDVVDEQVGDTALATLVLLFPHQHGARQSCALRLGTPTAAEQARGWGLGPSTLGAPGGWEDMLLIRKVCYCFVFVFDSDVPGTQRATALSGAEARWGHAPERKRKEKRWRR